MQCTYTENNDTKTSKYFLKITWHLFDIRVTLSKTTILFPISHQKPQTHNQNYHKQTRLINVSNASLKKIKISIYL